MKLFMQVKQENNHPEPLEATWTKEASQVTKTEEANFGEYK